MVSCIHTKAAGVRARMVPIHFTAGVQTEPYVIKERFIIPVPWMGFFFGLQEIHEQMNNEQLQSFEQGSGCLKYTREPQLLFWVVTRKV